MTGLLLPALVFVCVSALIGVLAFVFRGDTPKAATRLDMLVGKRRKEDDGQADILRKTAFENDKKSLLELLTPKFLSPQKMFEQADCHIKPSTLFGIGILLASVGVTVTLLAKVPWFFAAVQRPWSCSSLPLGLAVEQAAQAAGEVRRAAARRAGTGGPGLACRPQSCRPACTWSPRKCRRRSPTSSAACSRNRTWASPSRRP